MMVKSYGNGKSGENCAPEKRYSPAEFIGCVNEPKIGNPNEKHISMSYLERQNLTCGCTSSLYLPDE
jgi:hypothetical protein